MQTKTITTFGIMMDIQIGISFAARRAGEEQRGYYEGLIAKLNEASRTDCVLLKKELLQLMEELQTKDLEDEYLTGDKIFNKRCRETYFKALQLEEVKLVPLFELDLLGLPDFEFCLDTLERKQELQQSNPNLSSQQKINQNKQSYFSEPPVSIERLSSKSRMQLTSMHNLLQDINTQQKQQNNPQNQIFYIK
jgi:hypothetical protein